MPAPNLETVRVFGIVAISMQQVVIPFLKVPFFRLFCLVTKENGKNWDHWWHSLTHIFVYSQGTVLICQGNTFRCGR